MRLVRLRAAKDQCGGVRHEDKRSIVTCGVNLLCSAAAGTGDNSFRVLVCACQFGSVLWSGIVTVDCDHM
jgi:hypothetical protein